jgi:peptidase E
MTTATATTGIDRTGPAVREALATFDAQACTRFEAEFHTAIAETQVDFDTTRITDVVNRWWAYTIAEVNPDPEADAAWARIKADDESDIVEQWRPQPDSSHDVYRKNAAGEWMFSYHRPAIEA